MVVSSAAGVGSSAVAAADCAQSESAASALPVARRQRRAGLTHRMNATDALPERIAVHVAEAEDSDDLRSTDGGEAAAGQVAYEGAGETPLDW